MRFSITTGRRRVRVPPISLLRYGFAGCLFVSNILHAQQAQPFTLQQVLSAPYASELIAAPVGNLFAWVENAEGRHNLWIGGKGSPARQLTHNTADDGLEITDIAWSPDAKTIATTYGTPSGTDGKPANPAHLQHPTTRQVILQPLDADAEPIILGEGHAPLFTHDGKSILFLRNGQVWIADIQACAINKACHPERSLAASSQGGAEGLATFPNSPILPATFSHQLIFDRGTASQLTLSPDGNTLAFISRRNESGEPSHSYLALFDLRALVLTFPAPSTGNDSAPAFSPDGQHLAWLRAPFTPPPEYTPQRTSPNPWSIQLLDLTQPITTPGLEGTTPGFEGAVLQPRRGSAPQKVGALAPEGNPRTLFSPEPNQPGSALPHLATGEPYLIWTADNKIIFYSEADGWLHLYSLDTTHNIHPQLLTPGAGEIEDATLATDGSILYASNIPTCDQVAGYTTGNDPIGGQTFCDLGDADLRHLWRLDAHGAKPLTNGDAIETHPQMAADGTIAALISDHSIPMHPAIIPNGGPPILLNANSLPTPFPLAALTNLLPHSVSIPSASGTSRTHPLHAQLFLPEFSQASSHPAIIFLHGGPNRQMLLGYPAMEYYSNAYAFNQYLASRGFIVLSVNYRMGIGYGMDFRETANVGPNGAASTPTSSPPRKYLRSRPDVDPKRIGLWGGSYGGYLTAARARAQLRHLCRRCLHQRHLRLEPRSQRLRLEARLERRAGRHRLQGPRQLAHRLHRQVALARPAHPRRQRPQRRLRPDHHRG